MTAIEKMLSQKLQDAEYAILGWISRHKKGCSCNGCRYWVRHVDIDGASEAEYLKAENRFK